MIYPKKAAKFNRTKKELEEFLLFTIIAAGKNAHQQAKKLEVFLGSFDYCARPSPLTLVWMMVKWNCLDRYLRHAKIGQYQRVSKAFTYLANHFWNKVDLKTCTIKDLEQIPGVGHKTARYFIIHSRRNQQVACLDVHVLSWMRENGYPNAPKASPKGNSYMKWEQLFLKECKTRGITASSFDLDIWKSRAIVFK